MQPPSTPLDLISAIWQETKEKDFQPEIFDSLNHLLEPLAAYLQVSKPQAFILAHIFVLNCNNETGGLLDIAKHMNCNPVKLLVFKKDTAFLCENGYLKKKQASVLLKEYLSINDNLMKAIAEHTELPVLKKEELNDVITLLQKAGELYDQRKKDEIDTNALLMTSYLLLNKFSSLQFMQAVQNDNMSMEEIFFFLIVCWKTIKGNEFLDLSRTATAIFDDAHTRITFVQNFLNKRSELSKTGWVELEEARFFNDTVVKLSESGIAILELENIRVYFNKTNRNELIKPEQIQSKGMFYNQQEEAQIRRLEQILNNEQLLQFQERLRNKQMPTGVTILLYGPPGTGKTETVLQLAQKTQREIFKVEISKTKSMWYGESEKLIKKVFDDYRTFLKSTDTAPILLFNEADGIISKRKDVGISNVEQTENAIQNIILEELEKFEGLFMATTNLVSNFDKAFERRFLFKVELGKPQLQTRKEIWKSKLSFLEERDAELLSRKFEFSGGQIDNIARKTELVEVLEGRLPDINELIGFCTEESLHNKMNGGIGFKV